MKYLIVLLIAVDIAINISNNLKLKKVMADQQQFQEVLDRIDIATTKAADDLRALRDQISGQGLPADVENQILSRLTATADKLEEIAADPENPVPDGTDESAQG